MHDVCLRHFNVHGPHQRFDAYGNVIPIFADRILKGAPMTVFGDARRLWFCAVGADRRARSCGVHGVGGGRSADARQAGGGSVKVRALGYGCIGGD